MLAPMPEAGIQFFATREDLEEVIEAVEAERALTFVRAGLFDEPSADSVDSLRAIQHFGVAPAGDSMQCPNYLVGNRPFVPVVRSVLQRRGGTKYAIDQLENPQTISIRPGGAFGDFVLIAGTLGTSSHDAVSLELYRLFMGAFRLRFQAIKSFRVGRSAARLLDAGARLTQNVSSPVCYDLTRG